MEKVTAQENLKQVTNPYLPSWEYVPDGEPYVFDDRVYVYGSHDFFNGDLYCMGDYVCWSAPVDDLGQWRYEGVIYRKDQDPHNGDLQGNLYAPDVTIGPDGRYYLYYVLSNVNFVSVAVCDTPAGAYQFYGYVHYPDGTLLGLAPGDEAQFDPAVLTENGKTYLYTGFCGVGDPNKHGAMATVLEPDMLTVREAPVYVVPSTATSAGTGYEGHEFFEASSIRKKDGLYYFIYSSVKFHELCYAISREPTGGFVYQGVLVSSGDLNIDTYKPAEKCAYYTANNHGSMVEIGGEWYIFYHRHTNGTNFSRQGCLEKLHFRADGTAPQAEMTSCGLNGGPLEGKGEYPAYLACNLFTPKHSLYLGEEGAPKIMQDGRDGDEEIGYIGNITDGTTAGFKYFDCHNVSRVSVTTRGYAQGIYEVRTKWDGDSLGEIKVEFSNVWETYSSDISLPDGVNSFYLTFKGSGNSMLRSFTLE